MRYVLLVHVWSDWLIVVEKFAPQYKVKKAFFFQVEGAKTVQRNAMICNIMKCILTDL